MASTRAGWPPGVRYPLLMAAPKQAARRARRGPGALRQVPFRKIAVLPLSADGSRLSYWWHK